MVAVPVSMGRKEFPRLTQKVHLVYLILLLLNVLGNLCQSTMKMSFSELLRLVELKVWQDSTCRQQLDGCLRVYDKNCAANDITRIESYVCKSWVPVARPCTR